MLRAKRQQQRILGRRCLQLEIELTAEAFPQRERPRLVDAAAERRVQHELHAAGFVEETLEDERLLRRNHAEGGPSLHEIACRLLRAARTEAGFCLKPFRNQKTWRGVKPRPTSIEERV